MTYKTSELAKLAGISNRTLRHYDTLGLLKPKRIKDSNYRIYDQHDVDKLQHILILKEMGFDLSHIQTMLVELSDEKRMKMLESHVMELQHKKNQLDGIIQNVMKTIQSIKGEINMSDHDKFEGLKEQMIQENDDLYQDEVIQRWGNDTYQKSRNAFKNFTQKTFDHFNDLAKQIIETLHMIKKEVSNKDLKIKVAKLHQEWLTIAWGNTYDSNAHLNIVDMYVQDERFKQYYDQHGEGYAALLRDAVHEYLLSK